MFECGEYIGTNVVEIFEIFAMHSAFLSTSFDRNTSTLNILEATTDHIIYITLFSWLIYSDDSKLLSRTGNDFNKLKNGFIITTVRYPVNSTAAHLASVCFSG